MKKILSIIASLIFSSCNSQSDKKFNLEKVLNLEYDSDIVIAIDEYLNEKSEFGEKIEKLNSSQKTVLFVENLEREVNNGGLNQFYFNSSGDFSIETLYALLKIGAKKTAKVLMIANSEFPNGIIPKDREQRIKIIEQIEDKSNEIWNSLDEKFYTSENEIDNLTDLLITFIKSNKKDFIE